MIFVRVKRLFLASTWSFDTQTLRTCMKDLLIGYWWDWRPACRQGVDLNERDIQAFGLTTGGTPIPPKTLLVHALRHQNQLTNMFTLLHRFMSTLHFA